MHTTDRTVGVSCQPSICDTVCLDMLIRPILNLSTNFCLCASIKSGIEIWHLSARCLYRAKISK